MQIVYIPSESMSVQGKKDEICVASPDKKQWSIEFSGIAPNTYIASVAADGILVDVEPLLIKPALGGGDGDLP